MPIIGNSYALWLAAFLILGCLQSNPVQAQYGVNDTILVAAVVYEGDTIEAKTLAHVAVYRYPTADQRNAKAAWTRLRNAVYVTYPYARRAGSVFNDVNAHLALIKGPEARKKYIRSREKELRKEFAEPLSNLSVYQGKVLMKL